MDPSASACEASSISDSTQFAEVHAMEDELTCSSPYPEKHLSWKAASVITGTYCVSSSTVFMPFIFGHLGIVGGTLLLGGHFLLCCKLQLYMADLCLKVDGVRNLSMLAKGVNGPLAEAFFSLVQFSNQFLNLPLLSRLTVTSSKALLYPVAERSASNGFWGCDMTWLLLCTVPLVCCVNITRKFSHAEHLCLITFLINIIQVFLFVVDTFTAGPVMRPRTPISFLPMWPNGDLNSRGHWSAVFSSFSLFNYCYVPAFICAELMSEMTKPAEMQKSLKVSASVMYAIYVCGGIAPVVMWGWDRDANILAEMHHSGVSRCANLFLLLPSAMDIIICAISVNQMVLHFLLPSLNIDDWGAKARLKWFVMSVVPMVVSFVMLCFVHRLTALAGLLTCFAAPFAQILGPAYLSMKAANQDLFGRRFSLVDWTVILVGFVVGIFMVIVGVTSTAYDIYTDATQHYQFPCDIGLD